MTIQAFTLAAVAALALNVTEGARAQSTQPPMAAEPQAKSGLAQEDRSFMDDAAQAGQMEIQGSKLALEKSRNETVRKFAQKMIDEHGKAAAELSALAARKQYKLPIEPSIMQKAKLKTLDVRDESFDDAYADTIGVTAHEDAVKLFEEASNKAKDSDVKAFATKTLPVLREHLEMARAMNQATEAAKK